MSNIETIDLSLEIRSNAPFIDGHHLRLNITNHLPQLNKLTFNIRSETCFYNENNIPSNDYIQQTFGDFPNKQIISCVDYFQDSRWSLCHFYSYPYPSQLTTYERITNHFPGGLFRSVRRVQLDDERPFEHDFFRLISQSFPRMETLYIINKKAQKNKRINTAQDPHEDSAIIEYPYLLEINLLHAHEDYHKQFLFDDRACLPSDISVSMDYRLAEKVTHNFTRNETRNNCAKIGFVSFRNKSNCPDHIKDYFPRVNDVDYF